MSEYEKKNNRGAAFGNKTKEKPSQPDFIGTSIIDGKEKRVAVWKNKSNDGSDYLTFIFSDPLSEEEKHNYRNSEMPAQAPMKKFDKEKQMKNTNLKNENNDSNDLQEIINLNDEDSPF